MKRLEHVLMSYEDGKGEKKREEIYDNDPYVNDLLYIFLSQDDANVFYERKAHDGL